MPEDRIVIHPSCHELHLKLDRSAVPTMRTHGLTAAGLGMERGEYEICRHQRTGHQLLYSLGGEGWLKQNGQILTIAPGQALITPHGCAQHYGLAGDEWSILWFNFEAGSSFWRQTHTNGLQPAKCGEALFPMVRALYDELNRPQQGSSELISALCQSIDVYLERELHPLMRPDRHEEQRQKLNALVTQVQNDLARKWTVEDLAEASALHVCPDHFSRLCKDVLGKRPLQLVTELRMRKAAELLTCSDYKLELLACLLGYASPFSLSDAFKRHYSVSPERYRAGQRAK